jgi:hypothetical protein
MPIKNNGICNPKLVKIALSFDINPAIVHPTTPSPWK